MNRGPSHLHLRVVTSRKLLTDDEIQELFLPGLEGLLGIYPGHRPLLIALGKGRLSYRSGSKHHNFAVDGGYAEVLPDRVVVFTELSRENSDESDIEE